MQIQWPSNSEKMEMNSMVFDIRFKPSWVDEVCKDLLINKICEMTCYQKTLQNMQKSFLLNGPWRILAHNLWETSLAD